MNKPRSISVLLSLLTVLSVSACGFVEIRSEKDSGGDDAGQAAAAVRNFVGALGKGDAKAICKTFSKSSLKTIQTRAAQSKPEYGKLDGETICKSVFQLVFQQPGVKDTIKEDKIFRVKITGKQITVLGNTAYFSDAGGKALALVKEGDSWRIDATDTGTSFGSVISSSVTYATGGSSTDSSFDSEPQKTFKKAGIGDSLVLTGEKNGQKVDITVTSVIAKLPPEEYGEKLKPGETQVGIELKLVNKGSVGLDPSDIKYESSVTGSNDKNYETVSYIDDACNSGTLSGSMAPGESRSVCYAFKLPAGVTAKSLRLQYGYDAPEIGIWSLES